jgi:hypothetical protein
MVDIQLMVVEAGILMRTYIGSQMEIRRADIQLTSKEPSNPWKSRRIGTGENLTSMLETYLVWVSTENWKTERPSCKLDYQIVGPYRILEKIGHSYRIDLLETIRVHLVFSPDKLQKASNDPLLGQRNDPPLPIQVNGNDEWEVDEILASKVVRGSLRYRVSWKGYDPNPTWYPAWNFVGYPQKLKEFHNNYLEQLGLPKYLDEWIEC